MQKNSEFSKQLSEVQKKRGYLLPHHGLLAASTPALLEAYDALYSGLTLNQRHLSRHEHEYVWLAVLMAKNENLGTHHVRRFLDAAGTDAEFERLLTLTAFARGAANYVFASEYWTRHLPSFDAEMAYKSGFQELVGTENSALFHLAAAAAHMCCGHWQPLGWQIKMAYEDQTHELALVEALSLALLPAGVPNFAKAAGVWRQLILEGEIEASDELSQWARLAGQGGFDEAAGL